MSNVVRVLFNNPTERCICLIENVIVNDGDSVVVECGKGLKIGAVCGEVFSADSSKLFGDLRKIIRVATKEDLKIIAKNINDSKEALLKARDLQKKMHLNMNLLSANFTFDRSQLIFNFTADDRVDFRELAKKLASIYKTRIELRQIGVRDKAKEVGGIGPCGRNLCCNLFLNDFDSVSINMAKNQYISLKPNKINGICGRLLCCLNYENDQYLEMKSNFPNIGSFIIFNGEKVKVVSHDLFKENFTVEKSDKSLVVLGLEEYEGCK